MLEQPTWRGRDCRRWAATAALDRVSAFGKVKQMEEKKIDELRLQHIMQDKALTEKFLGFLQRHLCAENFLFWLVAEAYRTLFDEKNAKRLGIRVNPKLVRNQADKIFEKYLDNDAPHWVCVEPSIIQTIREALAQCQGEPSSELFSKAQEQALQTLERDCIPRFVRCMHSL